MIWLGRLIGARPMAALVITVVTLAVIGGVLFTTTPVACGPAQKAGLKLQQCARTVASRSSPTPFGFPSPTATINQPYTPPASEPYTPPASEPYYPPASGYCPPDSGPYCPGSSGAFPPQGPGPATGSYPPFQPPSTGSNGTIVPSFSVNCRLPIYVGPSGSGGFIVFPGDTFVADPTSAVSVPPVPAGAPAPQLPPGSGGAYGLAFDAAVPAWLPVPATWVSPDGAHYVFPSTSSLYVVDARSKALTEIGQGHVWSIIGVGDDAAYAEVANTAGLWKLPFAGTAKQLTTAGFWQMASRTAAYGTESSSLPNGITNTIIKLDLATGQLNKNFYSREGTSSTVIGFDKQGNPFVTVAYFAQDGGQEVWLVTASGSTPIFGSGGIYGMYLQGTPIADSHGVWFPLSVSAYTGSIQGFALYIAGSGLYWMSGVGGQLGGGCA